MSFSSVVRVLLLSLTLTYVAEAWNILVVLPIPIYSHTLPFMPVLRELGKRGHNLTVITPFPQDPNPQGFNQINVKVDVAAIGTSMRNAGINGAYDLRGFSYKFLGVTFSPSLNRFFMEALIKVLPSPESVKFDLIIAEPFYGQELTTVLGYIYDAPIVGKNPGPVTPIVAYLMGNPNLDAYTPNVRLAMTEDMTFFERLINFLVTKSELVYYLGFVVPELDKLMRELFPGVPDLPPFLNILQNVSLLMTETHFAVNYHRPLHRNIIEIGGVGGYVSAPLPQDLEKILNESTAGVIYFSWGSHFYDPNMNETIAALMETFSKLEQVVLFKWSNVNLQGVPKNVVLRSWFPQNTILAHKNVVLYISHGGLNSIYEAVYHGVPVVGTPLFVDQPHNILILKHFGVAEMVNSDALNDGVTLLNAIKKVLSDPRYKENALKRSRMLRDRPLPMLQEVVYWIEYVMKNGRDSLRPASFRLPWYVLTGLDVIIFIGVVFISVIIAIVAIVLFIKQKITKTEAKNKKD